MSQTSKNLEVSNHEITLTIVKRSLVILSIAAVALLLCGYALLQLSNSRSFQLFGGLTDRVQTNEKVAALTFDDAPSPHVSAVLSTLQAKQVKATFYEIGRAIEEYPDEARAIVDAGMEVGNHSYSHQRFLFQSQAFIDVEIQKTSTLIRDTGYRGEITFRPPNGKKLIGLPWYLAQHDIKTITWDVEPETYASDLSADAKTEFLVRYTLEHTRPGSIILLHPFCDSCASARQALPEIIDRLAANGYRFATVSELLRY